MGYKCGKCGGVGHNRRSCSKNKIGSVHEVSPVEKTFIKQSGSGQRSNTTQTSVSAAFDRYKDKAQSVSLPTLRSDASGKLGKTTREDAAKMASQLSFEYGGVSVNYNTAYSCSSSGCDKEGICRCGKIYGVEIQQTNAAEMANYILRQIQFKASKVSPNKFFLNEEALDKAMAKSGVPEFNKVDEAALERILVHETRVWDEDSWDVRTAWNYYGEEIEGVKIAHPQGLERTLGKFLARDTNGRMMQALEAEYGQTQVNDRFSDKTFVAKTLPIEQVRVGNPEHMVRKSPVYSPSEVTGIVLCENGKYRLMDGYHRLDAALEEGKTEAIFIVAE